MNNNIINPLITASLFILSFLTIPITHAHPNIPFPNISSIPPTNITNITAVWDSFRNLAGCRSGDNKPGLDKLKRYFQQFGYLNDQNYTNFFDQSFLSALITYQLNFNLNSTGELDDNTINQILSPRCGVPDIVNGTSTMNSGKPKTPSSLGVVAHYSFFPGSPRWPAGQTRLTYAFNPDDQLDGSVKAVFKAAFDKWSTVTPLIFSEIQSFRRADITIGFESGDHGDGEAFDGVLGTLAHAFSPPNGRLHLDRAENWVINLEDLRRIESAVDLESVVVHEIGHLLGLGHSSVEEAIMFPSISSGIKKVVLANDDVDGIQALYGSNPNYKGSSSNPHAQEERDTSHAPPPPLHSTSIWAFLLAPASLFFLL